MSKSYQFRVILCWFPSKFDDSIVEMSASESSSFRVEAAEETTEFIKIFPKDFSTIPLSKDWKNISFYKRVATFSLEETERVHNFEVFEDDVWIITNPKCGTTWTQEMCWLILNDLDFDRARQIDIEERSPFLEFNMENVELCEKLSRPRLIKTHQPIQLLPKDIWVKNPKMIYVVRDPRDAFVSVVHHLKFFLGKNAIDNKLESIEKSMKFTGFYEHVLDYFQLRGSNENFIFFSFEQMKKDLKRIVLNVCDFLGKSYSDHDINKLVEHLDFKNMKGRFFLAFFPLKFNFIFFEDNESCSHRKELEYVRNKINLKDEDIDPSIKFIRKGQVGSYKEELPNEFLEKMDIWEKQYLDKYNLTLNDILFTQ